MPGKTHGILIRTYDQDAPRLAYCLRSIEKFCKGFDQVVVVCPGASEPAIRPIVEGCSSVELRLCTNYENDYIGQQITKLRSHEFLETDFVFHIDSDCVFTQAFHPSDYVVDELPILYHREYDYFYRHGRRVPWQGVTSYFLRRQVDFEFMALFPLVYPRTIYGALERWFERVHGFPFENLIGHLNAAYEFSEFNLLGAFSYYYEDEFGPFHRHLNWGTHSAEHYLIQLCQTGRTDRSISPDEAAELERITSSG
jgi:hypothetical protein